MRRLFTGVAAVAASLALATTALAAAATATHYEAGTTANGPYAIVTVVHHKVTSVRWRFLQTDCDEDVPTPLHTTAKLDARIGRRGHFSQRVRNPFDGTTTFSGTVTATRATVKIVNTEGQMFGTCNGSRTFHARLVTRVH